MIRKALTYSGFVAVSMLVVLAFVTAQSPIQLSIAVMLYPLLVYFAYTLFIGNNRKVPITVVQPSTNLPENLKVEKDQPQAESGSIADIDKRTFLKLIGTAGISFFLFSLFNRRSELSFFGKKESGSGTTTLQDPEGNKVNPARQQPTDSYTISEIDDEYISYYGFTDKEGAWFIMREDPDDGSFRYTKGDSNFPGNWTNRKDVKYDYFNNVFSEKQQ